MDQHSNLTLQVILLSAAFIFWCAVVYTLVCIVLSGLSTQGGGLSDRRRRVIDGGAGAMILLAASFIASA